MGLVRVPGVVELEVLRKARAGGAHTVVGLEVGFLVLHAPPQPLNEHFSAPAGTPFYALLRQARPARLVEFDAAELASLWCVLTISGAP